MSIPDGLEYPMYLYIIAVTGHFAVSGAFHIVKWSPHIMLNMRRLDHVMIFIKMITTYLVFIHTVVPDINPWVLYFLFTGVALGITMRLFFTNAPKKVICLPYLMVGWSLVLDPITLMALFNRIPDGGVLAVLAGIFYTVGAGIYINKYPHPFPKYMGFHEVFHIFTTIAAVLLTISIFHYAIPYYNELQSYT